MSFHFVVSLGNTKIVYVKKEYFHIFKLGWCLSGFYSAHLAV